MTSKLLDEHKRLVKMGKYKKARRLLHILLQRKKSTLLCKKPIKREVIKYA